MFLIRLQNCQTKSFYQSSQMTQHHIVIPDLFTITPVLDQSCMEYGNICSREVRTRKRFLFSAILVSGLHTISKNMRNRSFTWPRVYSLRVSFLLAAWKFPSEKTTPQTIPSSLCSLRRGCLSRCWTSYIQITGLSHQTRGVCAWYVTWYAGDLYPYFCNIQHE